mmetsp:Transcript_6226/g.7696  ORF Transcript_6226/g.7696 Transcript_6226/m.7696 type:complete len:441 (+) Transcript_6226:398-1720(+)
MTKGTQPLINFFKGHPTNSLLPAKEIADSYKKVLLEYDYSKYDNDPLNRHALTYGADAGNLDTRKVISKWNNKYFGRNDMDPDCINLTGGASYGFANILASVTDTKSITQRGFIVSPTYYLITPSFIDAGFENKLTAVVETPGEEYEIDLKYLEEQLEFYDKDLPPVGNKEINIISDASGRPDRKLYRYVIYIVPTYSNPGGLVYSTKTRKKLIELARMHDMLIVSDDVYELLNYTDSDMPIPRFCYLDRDSLPDGNKFGNTISNATVSKILAPGLRFGWQETPTPKLVQQLAITGANLSGGTPGQLASIVVQDLITSGQSDTIISGLIKEYKSRAQMMIRSIKKFLPACTKVYGGEGGYFLWVTINADIDHNKIVDILKEEYNIILASGSNFEVCGDEKGWGKNSVRLSVSFLNVHEIENGIRRWGEVLRREHIEIFRN